MNNTVNIGGGGSTAGGMPTAGVERTTLSRGISITSLVFSSFPIIAGEKENFGLMPLQSCCEFILFTLIK
jgi:hypothetical protein